MKNVKFAILFLCVLGATFYFGSKDNTYAHKFLMKTANRFPANNAAKSLGAFWVNGQFKTVNEDGEVYKAYFSSTNPPINLCEAHPEVGIFKMTFVAEAAVSDELVSMTVKISCDEGGVGKPSPVFVKSFCSQPLEFYKGEQSFLNSTFVYRNVLDGFPKTWFAESIEPVDREGGSIVGIRPPQKDVTVDGKFTIDCLDF